MQQHDMGVMGNCQTESGLLLATALAGSHIAVTSNADCDRKSKKCCAEMSTDLESEQSGTARLRGPQVRWDADSECGYCAQQSQRHRQDVHLCIAVLTQGHRLASCSQSINQSINQ